MDLMCFRKKYTKETLPGQANYKELPKKTIMITFNMNTSWKNGSPGIIKENFT